MIIQTASFYSLAQYALWYSILLPYPKIRGSKLWSKACQQNKALSPYTAAKIYECGAPSTVTRHLRGVTKRRKAVATTQQSLAPVEEETIIEWAL
jgi:hypothetical protein